MFARAHRSPDPKSSSTLANFPLLDFSRAFKHPHIFPRLLTALFFLSLFPNFIHSMFPSANQQLYTFPCSSLISYSLAIALFYTCAAVARIRVAILPYYKELANFFLCFLLYSSYCMLISYHNRQRLIIFAKIKETNGCNSKSRNYHIIC